MIDPHWTVIDLDPTTWRNLGRFFDPGQYLRTARPGEHALYVLHDGATPLSVYDTRQGHRADLVRTISDPRLLAHDLYESGEWDRVHVINKHHLAEVARQSNVIENRALTLDAYYRRVFELVWRNPLGYVSLPPHPGHWNHWTYGGVAEMVKALPNPCSAVLGVLDGDAVHIGLILELRDGLVRTVTTFEGLGEPEPIELSAAGLGHLCQRVEDRFAPVGAALICDLETFESWLQAPDKFTALQAAAKAGRAFWRLLL